MQQEVAERRSPSSSSHSNKNKENRETTRWSCRLSHRGDVYIVDKMKRTLTSLLSKVSLSCGGAHIQLLYRFLSSSTLWAGSKKVALSPSSSLSPIIMTLYIVEEARLLLGERIHLRTPENEECTESQKS